MSLFKQMVDKGVWRGYNLHVMQLNPVLECMAERGIPVDPDAFKSVVERLTNDFTDSKRRMQELVPFEVKAKKVYKKVPKKNLEECIQVDGKWVRPLPWTPSNKGLIAYMRHRGHPVPKALKTERDTTNAIEIIRLSRSTKDPLYKTVIEYRKAQTILKNHVKNWAPGSDGRVHTTFYFDPSTGQLSSRRPNVQNAPKHDDPEFGGYARVFRSMVKAREGHSILEFDYKAFHVQTLGFEAQDADLMRVGRLDIHSFVTAHMLHLNTADRMFALRDDELGAYLAWVKKNHKHYRDAKAKHALLGYNNGMGYRKLYMQYRENFENETEAKRVMEALDHLFPKAKHYREAICQKAHEQGYLVSRHGYIRYFWEVFRYRGPCHSCKGKGCQGCNGSGATWSHGDDHEAALCFYTQNDAHGELKDRILTLATNGLDEKYGLLNTIHDSIIFECQNSLVEECTHEVKCIMQAPSTVLIDPVVAPNGLSVEVDAQGGPDWANMKGL